ncbi:hypothetical protein [Pseudidiomarina woesei]|uniref:Anti-sigma-K factor rskA n=1 Tax=Pseudidiomarina woesei TaxID=1381080 RepID=A0A0K6H123_9GAMM|nr:hypothetical protein [Pseudidiomarina woesei]CUA84464.1 Anti-sigma-K factor rskA [Pseudidiomarina woesei]
MKTPNNSTTKNAAEQLDALLRDAVQQGGEIHPPKDLWRGIEASISRDQLRDKLPNSKSPWAWFSGVAAAAFVGFGVLMGTLMHTPASNQNDTLHSSANLLAMVNTQHQQQRDILLANYEAAGLTPTFSELELELKQLRDAAIQVTQQLQSEPNNAELWQFLQWLHQQELDLLKTMYLQTPSYQQI